MSEGSIMFLTHAPDTSTNKYATAQQQAASQSPNMSTCGTAQDPSY